MSALKLALTLPQLYGIILLKTKLMDCFSSRGVEGPARRSPGNLMQTWQVLMQGERLVPIPADTMSER